MKPSGFYVDPFLRCSLILIPSIQHEKSDYLFQDNRFFLSDPPGARTQDPNIKSVVLSRHLKAFACGSTFKCNLLSKRILTINQ